MSTDEIREKYLKFFGKKGHKRIAPSPLVLEEDPTTLFTSSGMQQLVPYLMGQKHPKGKRLVDSQPSFRTVDIDEVGDNKHTTFFEMLGNWSLGDYFKKEQLEWIWEFLTEELKLPKERLYVTVFEGLHGVPKDEESAEIWKEMGIPEEKIFYYGADENWWSRTGIPDEMPIGEIGGPDSEVFYEFKDVKHDKKFGKKCHPNCECGRFLEIANSVFIQYRKSEEGKLEELPQKNVDFGGGLERISAAVNEKPDIFTIDVFEPFVKELENLVKVKYGSSDKSDERIRVIADHTRAALMILNEDVYPSNKLQGYILRRLIRRSVFHLRQLKTASYEEFSKMAVDTYSKVYPGLSDKSVKIQSTLSEEAARFEKALDKGLRELERELERGKEISGRFAFDLYQNHGFPLELTLEILDEEGKKFSKEKRKVFGEEFEKHREKSRQASTAQFKGGLADEKEDTIKLHTATHLLHQALRMVLGEGVEQKGSNITSERLRFDFSHPEKVKKGEIKKVEKIVNEKIKEGLGVSSRETTLDLALDEGAIAFFGEKYGDKVTIYTIGDPEGQWFSKEVCGGPHVSNTKDIGRVRIFKQKKIGANVVRLYARLEKNG
jgi:alanyl-tRNA synthetase